jgi:hypothetical protein
VGTGDCIVAIHEPAKNQGFTRSTGEFTTGIESGEFFAAKLIKVMGISFEHFRTKK